MKILNERDKFLSNYEVMEHLKDIKSKYNWTFDDDENQQNNRKQKKRFTACGLNLEIITRDLLTYLNNSPCSAISSTDDFKSLMIYLNQFDLMKFEKLQIINSLPRSMVHLYALVEECDQRFDEATCDGIINKINELFPVEEEAEDEEAAQAGEEEEDEQFESAEDTHIE